MAGSPALLRPRGLRLHLKRTHVADRVACLATATIVSSTVSGNADDNVVNAAPTAGAFTFTNSLVVASGEPHASACTRVDDAISLGHNIESSGDTCGFDRSTDQVGISGERLNLGPLADNGGPTMTHALLAGSVAIDVIPEGECLDADGEPLTTDQRGEPRPAGGGCDVGAFEVQP